MIRFLSITAGLLFCLVPAFADSLLTVGLNPSSMTGNAGDEIIYFGTITGNSNIDPTNGVDLNDVCFSFTVAMCDNTTSPGLGFFTIDDGPIFNVPGNFGPGDMNSDNLFGVIIDPSTPSGTYQGTMFLLGGSDMFTFAPIGMAAFQVVVAPEPSTAFLFLLAGASLIARARGKAA